MTRLAKSRQHWVVEISRSYTDTVGSIIETGRKLIAAQSDLKHGEWTTMFDREELPFSLQVAQRYMRVASNPNLSNNSNWKCLPATLSTLDELAKLTSRQFNKLKATGVINANMVCRDIGGHNRIKPGKSGSQDKDEPPPPKQALLAEFESFVEQFGRSLKAREITKQDIRAAMGKLRKLLA